MIKVFLVDDHQLIRAGVRRLLEDTPDIRVVGEAESGEQALQRVQEHEFDVMLMDVSMPGIGGVEATRQLLKQYPQLKIIALSVHTDEHFPARLIDLGAMGYITKDCGHEQIIQAVRQVAEGRHYIDERIAQAVALSRLRSRGTLLERLSPREVDVMLRVVRGQTIQHISDALFLSPKTISTYKSRIFEKMGVRNDVELTLLAIRHGLLEGSRD